MCLGSPTCMAVRGGRMSLITAILIEWNTSSLATRSLERQAKLWSPSAVMENGAE